VLSEPTSTSVPFLDLAAMHAEVEMAVDEAWRQVTREGSYVGGPHVERFNQEWADYCEVGHSVGVANGTDALELILRALGIGRGDEVVVPANTFIATAEAVVAAGATPYFVDVDPQTLLITPETIRAALGPRTAAVIVVHLYGQMPDMAGITALARAHGLPVVEDAAQAHGATWEGRRAGSWGTAAAFSFYPGKNLGAFGDGGAVVTDDGSLAERVRSLADHGRSAASKHHHPRLGRNSRLDGLQAAVLSAKLPLLDRWNDGRRRAAQRYRTRLEACGVALVGRDSRSSSVYHLMVAMVPDRDELSAHLSAHDVGVGVHYPVPCHVHEPFGRYPRTELLVTERVADEILSLPMYPHLTTEDVDRVCSLIEAWR
jgi:dTDP-4-amino-4,6-dideoxygalactose transaminase